MSETKWILRDINNLVRLLPAGTVWDVMITHDTDMSNTAVFNIWVTDKVARLAMRTHLYKMLPADWEYEKEEEHVHSSYVTVAIREVD